MGRTLQFGLLLVVAALTVLPLAAIILLPFFRGGEAWLQTYAPLGSGPAVLAFKNTAIMSAGVVGLSLALGVPLAWLLTRTNIPGRERLRSLFMLPYIIPPYIGAIAWIDLANPNVGLLNRLLGGPVFDIYNLGGMILVLGLFLYTYVLLGVGTALANIDPSLEESARMCGASPLRVARDVSFPLVKPAIYGSGFLVFLAAAAAFGVPYLIGGARNIPVLTGLIYEKVRTGGLNGIFEASALSIVLLVPAVAGLLFIDKLSRTQGFAVVSGRAAPAATLDLGRFRRPAFFLCVGLLLLIVALPLSAILISSFLEVPGQFDRVSLMHFREVFAGQHQLGRVLLNSFLLAAGAATLAVCIGGAVAFLRERQGRFAVRAADFFLSIPFATPGIVVALGLLLAFSRGIRLTDTLWIILIAYFAKYASFVVRILGPNVRQIDPSLPEAATMCGAGPARRLATIWIPLLRPALFAGWFLVFMPSFSELTMSILLVGIGTDTVGTLIFRLQDYVNPDAAPVVALVVLVIITTANAIVKWLTRGRYGV